MTSSSHTSISYTTYLPLSFTIVWSSTRITKAVTTLYLRCLFKHSHLLKSIGLNMLLSDINQCDISLKPRYGKGFLWCSVKSMGWSLHALLGWRKTVGSTRTAGCSHTIVVHQMLSRCLRNSGSLLLSLAVLLFVCVTVREWEHASAWSHSIESVYLNVCFHNDTPWQESTTVRTETDREKDQPSVCACERWQQGHVLEYIFTIEVLYICCVYLMPTKAAFTGASQ